MHVMLGIVLAALLATAYVSYYRTMPPLSNRLRSVLIPLRMIVYSLLIVLFLDPRCAREGITSETAQVAVVIDRSESMRLPVEGGRPDGQSRFDAALTLAGLVDSSVAARGGSTRHFYFANDVVVAAGNSVSPDGQGTDITGSLKTIHEKLEGENCTAVVLLSDGVETRPPLIIHDVPLMRIFVVGLGDTTPPEDVRVKEVDYNPLVRAPSKQTLRAALVNSGTQPMRTHVTLTENGTVIDKQDVVVEPGGAELIVPLPVEVIEPGRRTYLVEIAVEGADAERGNNSREVIIDSEKAEISVLVVDQLPSWEHSFLTDLLKREETISFDLIGPRPHSGSRRFIDPAGFVTVINDYDVLVLSTMKPDFVGPEEAGAIERFITGAGKGMLIIPGAGSLFEHAAGWKLLESVLPVTGIPPCRFIFDYTEVIPGEQAALHAATADLLPLLSLTEWQERNPLLGYHSSLAIKSGAEELLVTRKQRMPALVYGRMEAGRVALICAGPLWRWKFLPEEGGVYDQLMSRLLDLLARGEDSSRFSLAVKKNLFEAGEPIDLFAELFDAKMQPVTGIPVRLEIFSVDSAGQEVPLRGVPMERKDAHTTRYAATLSPLPAAVYRLKAAAELQDRSLESNRLEIKVSDISVEYQTVVQDRRKLETIAARTNGSYSAGTVSPAFLDAIPVETRTRQTLSETALRTNGALFGAILLLLSVEWVIRKRAGMI